MHLHSDRSPEKEVRTMVPDTSRSEKPVAAVPSTPRNEKPAATYQYQPRKPHNSRRPDNPLGEKPAATYQYQPDRPYRPRSTKLRISEAPALLRRGVAAMILVMMALAGATAQDPVYQTVQVLPPYSNKLSHYFATPGRIMSIITTDLNNIDASEYR